MATRTLNYTEPRILIVEDDPTFLRVWERIFKGLGIKNYWLTNDPDHAKRILRKDNVDLIISDILLPKISGYDMAKWARSIQPEINVLLTTAFNPNLSRFHLEESEFHILHKPFNSVTKIQKLVMHLALHEDAFKDADESSFAENEDYPSVTEWNL
ncbi:response regulator [bacterium]|nr:response regulator [bacterium]